MLIEHLKECYKDEFAHTSVHRPLTVGGISVMVAQPRAVSNKWSARYMDSLSYIELDSLRVSLESSAQI